MKNSLIQCFFVYFTLSFNGMSRLYVVLDAFYFCLSNGNKTLGLFWYCFHIFLQHNNCRSGGVTSAPMYKLSSLLSIVFLCKTFPGVSTMSTHFGSQLITYFHVFCSFHSNFKKCSASFAVVHHYLTIGFRKSVVSPTSLLLLIQHRGLMDCLQLS